jgi:hypothetical protein
MTALPSHAHAGHLVVINRWSDAYALYDNYVEHDRADVTYVVTSASRSAVPRTAAAIVVVDDLADLDAVRRAIDEPVRRFGRPRAVVALNERDLRVASLLREEFGCPARRWDDLRHFLDKEEMLAAAAGTGVSVPAFAQAADVAEVARFADTNGWPVVVKPIRGIASAGVCRLDSPDDLDARCAELLWPVLVQRFIPHPVYHADGYFDGTTIRPLRLARYVNIPGTVTYGPLAFNSGEPVGETEIDDPRLLAAAEKFLGVLVPGMSGDPWIFHCELFIDDAPDEPVCHFLEVGCRPGGGEIPFVWRDVYGIDLMDLEFSLQCGYPPQPPDIPSDAQIGGSLLVPYTGTGPDRVVEATSMVGRPDGPYGEALPPVGSLVSGTIGSYESVGGRFRFAGPTTADVTRRILATGRDYVLRAEPVDDGELSIAGR